LKVRRPSYWSKWKHEAMKSICRPRLTSSAGSSNLYSATKTDKGTEIGPGVGWDRLYVRLSLVRDVSWFEFGNDDADRT
jgi:hypothetical protein